MTAIAMMQINTIGMTTLTATFHVSEIKKRYKRMSLYSAVYSPFDRSKRLTLHPLADLFIPTPTPIPWEAFSHAAITLRLFTQFPPPSITRYLFIRLSELGRCGENENAQTLKW